MPSTSSAKSSAAESLPTGSVHLGHVDDWPLRRALFFYGSARDRFGFQQGPSANIIVMDHRVDEEGRLLSGRPIDSDKFIHDVFAITHDRKNDPWIYPHQRAVAVHPRFIAWHQPAHERAMFFRTGEKDIDVLNRVPVQHPGLIFAADEHTLHVWACTDARPTQDSVVYRPPYLNCMEYGVCLGGLSGGLDDGAKNGAPPKGTPEYWEWRWWESTFTHAEPELSPGWNYARLAAHLINKKEFPYEALKKEGTVSTVLNSIVSYRDR